MLMFELLSSFNLVVNQSETLLKGKGNISFASYVLSGNSNECILYSTNQKHFEKGCEIFHLQATF